LTEYTYNASLAGLSGQFSNSKYGLLLSASGYNDKMDTFIESLLTVGDDNWFYRVFLSEMSSEHYQNDHDHDRGTIKTDRFDCHDQNNQNDHIPPHKSV
jgi:hypothetical protein